MYSPECVASLARARLARRTGRARHTSESTCSTASAVIGAISPSAIRPVAASLREVFLERSSSSHQSVVASPRSRARRTSALKSNHRALRPGSTSLALDEPSCARPSANDSASTRRRASSSGSLPARATTTTPRAVAAAIDHRRRSPRSRLRRRRAHPRRRRERSSCDASYLFNSIRDTSAQLRARASSSTTPTTPRVRSMRTTRSPFRAPEGMGARADDDARGERRGGGPIPRGRAHAFEQASVAVARALEKTTKKASKKRRSRGRARERDAVGGGTAGDG